MRWMFRGWKKGGKIKEIMHRETVFRRYRNPWIIR
jgi:hypothetical protein